MFKLFAEYLKEKANSTIIISLILFYGLCNCRWIFTSLFTDQNLIFEKYNMLKNEYIYEKFQELHPDNPWFWICTITPFILTYLYVWWAPKLIINPAYKQQVHYATERRGYKIKEENALLSLQHDTIKRESKNTEELIQLESKKEELNRTNPSRMLDEEYQAFKQNKNWTIALNELRMIIYGNYGNVPNDSNAELLMLLDINELIEPGGLNTGQIYITEKGKEFLKRASNSNEI